MFVWKKFNHRNNFSNIWFASSREVIILFTNKLFIISINNKLIYIRLIISISFNDSFFLIKGKKYS